MGAMSEMEEAVSLTKEDYFNIMSWWAHSVEMEKEASRGPIRASERDTVSRLDDARTKLKMRKKDVS